jgi:hypothetical protein
MSAPPDTAPSRVRVGRPAGGAPAAVASVEVRAPSLPVTRSPSPSPPRPARSVGDPESRILHRLSRSRRVPRELPVE